MNEALSPGVGNLSKQISEQAWLQGCETVWQRILESSDFGDFRDILLGDQA